MKFFLILILVFICIINLSGKSIKLITPNGGENYLKYSSIAVRWKSEGISYFKIKFSTDGGKSWFGNYNRQIYAAADITYETIFWSGASDSCLIKIYDYSDTSITDISDAFFSISEFSAYEYIAANEIFMWTGNNGNGSHDPRWNGNGFYWPGGINNDGKSAIFQDGLVWGGKIDGEIRVNGNTHRQGIRPGIILPNGKPDEPNSIKYRVHKLKKGWENLPEDSLKNIFRYNYNNWAADIGADYYDVNADGKYTPNVDAPKLIGDEVLYYTANDLDTTTSRYTYGSNPIGLEFHATVFAFNTNDALKDAVFKKYIIINKSNSSIENLYFSYWTDDDLGSATDDYIGCDSSLNLGFSYKSRNYDNIYGSPVPSVGHMLLQGPQINSSTNDSAFFNRRWHKGFKNLELSSFTPIFKHHYILDPNQGEYKGTIEFYNLMQCKTNEGHDIINPYTGKKDLFPLSGDPEKKKGWYQGEGWSGGIGDGDRRYLIISGPFTMAPGDTQEVVFAILIARGTSNLNSVTKLKENAAFIRDKFYKNFPDFEEEPYSIPELSFELFQNFPNPFNSSTKIRFTVPFDADGTPTRKNVTIKIYDILGREIETIVNGSFPPGNHDLIFTASSLASGVYIYQIRGENFSATKKMLLIR